MVRTDGGDTKLKICAFDSQGFVRGNVRETSMPRLFFVLFVLACQTTILPAAERYSAMFADGSLAEEAEVREWNDANAQPKIGGRNLFDPNNPVRWIIDRN